MDTAELQRRVLERHGIRVEPAMGEYVLRRLSQAGAALRELPIIGGDARTGLPIRATIDATALLHPANPATAAAP